MTDVPEYTSPLITHPQPSVKIISYFLLESGRELVLLCSLEWEDPLSLFIFDHSPHLSLPSKLFWGYTVWTGFLSCPILRTSKLRFQYSLTQKDSYGSPSVVQLSKDMLLTFLVCCHQLSHSLILVDIQLVISFTVILVGLGDKVEMNMSMFNYKSVLCIFKV